MTTTTFLTNPDNADMPLEVKLAFYKSQYGTNTYIVAETMLVNNGESMRTIIFLITQYVDVAFAYLHTVDKVNRHVYSTSLEKAIYIVD